MEKIKAAEALGFRTINAAEALIPNCRNAFHLKEHFSPSK